MAVRQRAEFGAGPRTCGQRGEPVGGDGFPGAFGVAAVVGVGQQRFDGRPCSSHSGGQRALVDRCGEFERVVDPAARAVHLVQVFLLHEGEDVGAAGGRLEADGVLVSRYPQVRQRRDSAAPAAQEGRAGDHALKHLAGLFGGHVRVLGLEGVDEPSSGADAGGVELASSQPLDHLPLTAPGFHQLSEASVRDTVECDQNFVGPRRAVGQVHGAGGDAFGIGVPPDQRTSPRLEIACAKSQVKQVGGDGAGKRSALGRSVFATAVAHRGR